MKIRPYFETNSSSSHSLAWGDGQEMSTFRVINGEVDLRTKEEIHFGWEWNRFNGPYYKAYYALYDDEDLAKSAIIAHTGARSVYFSEPEYGGIDHQSGGTLGEIRTVDKMVDFIFNRRNVLVTGNDNSSGHPNIRDKAGEKYKGCLVARYEILEMKPPARERSTSRRFSKATDYILIKENAGEQKLHHDPLEDRIFYYLADEMPFDLFARINRPEDFGRILTDSPIEFTLPILLGDYVDGKYKEIPVGKVKLSFKMEHWTDAEYADTFAAVCPTNTR